ncbi:hypothetical protein U8P80_10085 [Rhizobium beringeri]|uniref:hypothetical protein n=1 Tax=Rhizobium TaxID=379 RepID=UPI00036E90C9|nr:MULTISPECIES: hypothetical protein [Rhizobium]MBB4389402.1 hypothetical protein [Rhizobium leguminosarum]MCB2400073.1 hypothetical protein [Rhizobium ruizarguesonis]WSG75928.1 hypothetical protein U8P80_10085 [Rhizobium beringeri]WSH16123.1 hypothetical protein U8P74_10085 [Rhizobium beringeri]
MSTAAFFRTQNTQVPTRVADPFMLPYAKHLQFCMDVGYVRRAEKVVQILSQYDLAAESEVAKIVRSAAAWLVTAQSYEAEHGSGSYFNPTHPKHLEALARIEAR